MSNLELREFHSFLEGVIEDSSREKRFSIDKVVATVLSRHAVRLDKIKDEVMVLGLRALIRNNCRAKVSAAHVGPDLFGNYGVGKRVSVRYLDENGKTRWDKKLRSELSFDDLDGIIARLDGGPPKQSRDRKDYDDIARRAAPYRGVASTIGEALKMAERDELP